MNTYVHRHSLSAVFCAQRRKDAEARKPSFSGADLRWTSLLPRLPFSVFRSSKLFILSLFIFGCTASLADTSRNWQHYSVYQPRIERSFVVDAAAQPLRYNHDSTIAWFKDRWFCLWNANTVPREGASGQLNYVSTSRDGIEWSAPLPVFSAPEQSLNPVLCSKGTQWQPNLLVVGNRLWCLWSQHSKDTHKGCYFSVLDNPDGKWSNRQLSWNGETNPVIDGTPFRLFPTQNPVRLSTGRVLAPVTMMGPLSKMAPPGKKGWAWLEKRNSVIYSDDNGVTWQVSPGTVLPGLDWRQWEPTVFEQPDGSVLMFARNNIIPGTEDSSASTTETLTWSISHDHGVTWSPHAYVPLQTVISRMHVLNQNTTSSPAMTDRFIMIHNDWLSGTFGADRRNLALFFNRGSGIDFVAGTGLTGQEYQVAYPQMFLHDGKLLASYSQGPCAMRNIKVVSVTPLPDPKKFYIYPRNNLPPSPRCAIKDDALILNGGLALKGRVAPVIAQEGLSCAAWIKADDGGVFFDNRGARSGFVWGLSGFCFVHLGQPAINIISKIAVARDRWNYVGVTINYQKGEVHFFVNDEHDYVSFKPASRSMQGNSFTVGGPNLAASSLSAFEGSFRSFALYGDKRLSVSEHRQLFENRSATLPPMQPALRFDPSDVTALNRDFIFPAVNASVSESVQTAELDGRPVLRFEGGASAGIELAANERSTGDAVELNFSFKVEGEGEQTLCTVGDANQPARIVLRENNIMLVAGEQTRSCGKVQSGVWQRLSLSSCGDSTKAVLDDQPPVEIRHTPEATWLYLGEGYRSGTPPIVDTVFVIDIASVRSRILHPREKSHP
jgi:hypothetical protein